MNASTARYCFLDFDMDHTRRRLATAAAFVAATDTRYGFSSSDLRRLGGSEVSRIQEFMHTDHEWSSQAHNVLVRAPSAGQRILVRLDWETAPLACENFATLCEHGRHRQAPVGASGKPLTYQQSKVHRIIQGFIVQGGDLVFGNGSGGESIFGKKFKDERGGLLVKHDCRGILSMGNSGKNSNTSQWFLTLAPAPQCDGKHVVFGSMVSGWSVLDALEACAGDKNGTPSADIVVTDCGCWQPLETPGAGYWYDQPDPDAYCGVSPMFVVRPRVVVVAPAAAVGRFVTALQSHCVLVDVPKGDLVAQLTAMLDQFAVDVIVVAPASQEHVQGLSHLPTSWTGVDVSQVLLVAKPVDALAVVHTRSWMAQRASWTLDGIWQ